MNIRELASRSGQEKSFFRGIEYPKILDLIRASGYGAEVGTDGMFHIFNQPQDPKPSIMQKIQLLAGMPDANDPRCQKQIAKLAMMGNMEMDMHVFGPYVAELVELSYQIEKKFPGASFRFSIDSQDTQRARIPRGGSFWWVEKN